MNDEDDEFLDLFDGDVCYIDGGNQSGFYLVEEKTLETRYNFKLRKFTLPHKLWVVSFNSELIWY